MKPALKPLALGRHVVLRPEDFDLESSCGQDLVASLFGKQDGEGRYERETVELTVDAFTTDPDHVPLPKGAL